MKKMIIGSLLMLIAHSHANTLEIRDFLGDYKKVISCKERDDAYNVQGYYDFGLRISLVDGGAHVERCDQNSDWCSGMTPFMDINEGEVYLPDVGYTESYYRYYVESTIEERSLIRKEFTKSMLLRKKKNVMVTDKVTLNEDGTIEYTEFRGMTCLYSKN